MFRSRILISLGMLVATLPVASVLAAAAEEAALEEVIVTAQNREQSVQDVPIAIDVINAEQLRDAGFSDMNDIDQIAPVVQLNQDQGTVKITVRGVGTTSNDEAQDTSVVVNVDGEYINRPNILPVALFDMDRIEVLRGPQGTLYGRNSTGGAINFITRKAGERFGGNASASYGSYNALRLDAGLDVPLGTIGGLRIAGFHDQRDGYIDHPNASDSSDDNESSGGRVSFRLEPTDALKINLSAEYAQREITPATFAYTDLNAAGNGPAGPGCNATGYVQVAPNYPSTLCTPSNTNFLAGIDRDEYTAPVFGLGHLGQDTYAVRGRFSYEFSPAATLTYIGGYRSSSGDDDNFLALPVVYRSFGFVSDADSQSHELRLNGEIGGVIYQLGGFLFKEDIYNEVGFFLPIGPNGTFLSYFGREVSSESTSVFGQVEVPFGVEGLAAVGGLRYTDNQRDALYRNAAPFGPGPPDPALFNAGPARKDFADLAFLSTLNLGSAEDELTWLFGLNYKPNADTLVYGKVATGFKGGGFDSIGEYKPETNTAYEAGLKMSYGAAGRSTFNLAGFYYDYKDLQVSVLLDTAVGGQTFNAGKATIWGLEASTDFEVNASNILHATANYLNAEYKELFAQFNVFCVGGCGINGIGDLDPTAAGVQQPNFAGNRPPFSPEYIITLGYDHIFDLGGSGKLTASINSTLKGSYFTDFYNYRDGEQESFSQTDVSLEYRPASDRFSIQAFVRNIEDERPLTYGSFVSAGPDDIFNWQFGAPRTFGLRANVDF